MSNVSNPIKIGANPSFHPVIQADLCLNNKQNKFICTQCRDICPKDVFDVSSKHEPKWEHCVDCGLCVTSCPSLCFTPSSDTQRTLLEDVQPGETYIIACEQDPELLGRKVNCLGSVPWELFAVISFYTDIVIYKRSCTSCNNSTCLKLLSSNLEKLHSFLGENKFQQRIHILESGLWKNGITEEQKELSRRDVFSGTLQTIKKTMYHAAVSRLPQLDLAEKDSLQYRRMLSNAILKERDNIKKTNNETAQSGSISKKYSEYIVSLPAYTSACFGCNICERICPQRAIDITPEPSGTRLIYITPWKCTECSLCMEICPHEGLKSFMNVSVPYLERLPLVRVQSQSCEKCGTAIKPGTSPGVCAVCKAKTKHLRR